MLCYRSPCIIRFALPFGGIHRTMNQYMTTENNNSSCSSYAFSAPILIWLFPCQLMSKNQFQYVICFNDKGFGLTWDIFNAKRTFSQVYRFLLYNVSIYMYLIMPCWPTLRFWNVYMYVPDIVLFARPRSDWTLWAWLNIQNYLHCNHNLD